MFHVRSGFGAGAAAALAVVLAAGPAAASGWTVVPVPPAGQKATLYGVSADSASDAWAVGGINATNGNPLAEHWNGTSWQPMTVPRDHISGTITLTGVSAASRTDAWEVGRITSYGATALAWHWDGTGWTEIPGDTQTRGFLAAAGVADIGTGNAYAVGDYLRHWDGTSWTAQAYPDPAHPGQTTTFGALNAISADGANDVWAVGTYTTSASGQQTFSLHWNGTSWAGVPMVPVNRSTDPGNVYVFRSVDVISPADVWAAGYSSAGTLTEHFNGTRWTIVPTPSSGTAVLNGIDGSSPASVWAAGSYTPPGASQPRTLTLFWNGTSWATVPSPHPGSTSQLNSVTATPGAAATWAAGGYTSTSGATTPLALKNG
jgi:hypothetical protein